MGIPAGINIFEPFTTTKSEGTGLGLAICRQIAERHGGTIELQEHDGDGAWFSVKLPRCRTEQAVQSFSTEKL